MQEAVGAFSGYTLEDAKGGAPKKDAKPKAAPAEKPKKEEAPKPAGEESKPAPAAPPKPAPGQGYALLSEGNCAGGYILLCGYICLCVNGASLWACASQIFAQCALQRYASLVIGLNEACCARRQNTLALKAERSTECWLHLCRALRITTTYCLLSVGNTAAVAWSVCKTERV